MAAPPQPVSAPPPAASAAATATANPHKRKKQPKGKGRGNPGKHKKLKGPDDALRRRRKPSTKFLKLLEKRARDYNSDDEDEEEEKEGRRRPPPPAKRRDDDGDAAAVDSDDDDEEEEGLSDEEASSSGEESGGAVVTRFEQGCRAFRVAFSKIMAKKLPDDPLGPILSAHKKLVAAKLAEEAEEHKSKGESRKEKRIAAEKGHVMPAKIIDSKEKMLIKVATQGVVRLFNEVSKRQNPRKGLNPSRSKDVKALAKERDQAVPSNQGKKGKHIGKDEDEPGWAPLRDTYMLGSKLKDWDKTQDPDASKQTEVHLDNFSDEE